MYHRKLRSIKDMTVKKRRERDWKVLHSASWTLHLLPDCFETGTRNALHGTSYAVRGSDRRVLKNSRSRQADSYIPRNTNTYERNSRRGRAGASCILPITRRIERFQSFNYRLRHPTPFRDSYWNPLRWNRNRPYNLRVIIGLSASVSDSAFRLQPMLAMTRRMLELPH